MNAMNLELKPLFSMTAEDMKRISFDDLVNARFYFDDLSTSDKGLVESITRDVLFKNRVKRCSFDCDHKASEECFYENYKESVVFYVTAYIGNFDVDKCKALSMPILNAIYAGAER